MRAKRGFFAALGLRSHNNLQKIYDWDGNFEFIRAVWTNSSRGALRAAESPSGGRRKAGAAQRGRAARQGRPTEAEAAPAGVRGRDPGRRGDLAGGKEMLRHGRTGRSCS